VVALVAAAEAVSLKEETPPLENAATPATRADDVADPPPDEQENG
jgi:hypothetical protein